MAATFKLPKIDYDKVIVISTPDAATDVSLTTGLLSLKDETGAVALKVRIADIVGAKKSLYAGGGVHIRMLQLGSIALAANKSYSVTINIANRQDFFLYGKETNPLVALRNYNWSSGNTIPTAAQVAIGLAAVINADPESGVVALAAGNDLRLTTISVQVGQIKVSCSEPAATQYDVMSYIAPVGIASEVEEQAPGKSVSGTNYSRYVIRERKLIKHNAVSGLSVFKTVENVLYYNEAQTPYETAVDNILNGVIATTNLATVGTEVAKYFGVPSL